MNDGIPLNFNLNMAQKFNTQFKLTKKLERSKMIKKIAPLYTTYILQQIYDESMKGYTYAHIYFPDSLKYGCDLDLFEIYVKELEQKKFKCERAFKLDKYYDKVCISIYITW
jgi:hypothetical protein